jgi:hypothetical protein
MFKITGLYGNFDTISVTCCPINQVDDTAIVLQWVKEQSLLSCLSI